MSQNQKKIAIKFVKSTPATAAASATTVPTVPVASATTTVEAVPVPVASATTTVEAASATTTVEAAPTPTVVVPTVVETPPMAEQVPVAAPVPDPTVQAAPTPTVVEAPQTDAPQPDVTPPVVPPPVAAATAAVPAPTPENPPAPKVKLAKPNQLEIHSLMVGENRDDVHLYQGRTRAEMVANYLAAGEFGCWANGADEEFIADLEANLEKVPKHYPTDKTFKHYGGAFTVGDNDSDLFQYVVTRF